MKAILLARLSVVILYTMHTTIAFNMFAMQSEDGSDPNTELISKQALEMERPMIKFPERF